MNWFGLLGVVLVVAKLTGYLAWSWVAVLSPFWIPLTIGLLLLAVAGAAFLAACLAATNK